MEVTINKALVLGKSVRERLNDLKQLRQNSAVIRRSYLDGKEQERTEPQYDIKKVDQKCIELENFLFTLDSEIKQSNAQTFIKLDGDVKTLLSPVE